MDIIDKFCKYFEENNEEKFLSLFSENAIYNDCLYGKFQGKGEILNFYKRCHNEAANYNFIPTNKIISKNRAAFEWDFSFVSKLPYAKGKTISIKGCSFINMEKGKIIFYRDYADSVLFLLKGNVPDEKIIKFFRNKYKI